MRREVAGVDTLRGERTEACWGTAESHWWSWRVDSMRNLSKPAVERNLRGITGHIVHKHSEGHSRWNNGWAERVKRWRSCSPQGSEWTHKPRNILCSVKRFKDTSPALRKGFEQRENLSLFLFTIIVKIRTKIVSFCFCCVCSCNK